MRYDYKTVAAPRRPGKFKGIKGPDAFARTIEEAISAEAGAGWEYLRADTLPCEEKPGFFSRRQTVLHTILIFRRARAHAVDPVDEPAFAPQAVPAAAPAPQPRPAPEAAPMRLEPDMREEVELEADPRLGPAR